MFNFVLEFAFLYLSKYITIQFFIAIRLSFNELEEIHAGTMLLHHQLEEGVIMKDIQDLNYVRVLQIRQQTDFQGNFR